MSYITWEQYSSLYDDIAEEQFSRYEVRAHRHIDMLTHGRAGQFMEKYDEDTATAFQKRIRGQIESTMCELMNNMSIQGMSGMGSGIASVSNDGYSESYRITTDTELKSQLKSIVITGLSGTGLAGAL